VITKAEQPPFIIHMGYVRTSTTMHQQRIFAGHENIHYLGKPFPDDKVMAAFRKLACQDAAHFDKLGCYGVLREATKPVGSASIACVLLSDEIVLSQFSTDIEIVLGRLQSVFGDIKVLLTIREQFETFRSWCEHVLDKNEYGCLDTITNYHYKFRDTKDSLIAFLDYYRMFSFLRDKVGKERILMLPYELMRSQPVKYSNLLADFLGVRRESVLGRLRAASVENARGTAGYIRFVDFKKRYLFHRRHDRLDKAGTALFDRFPFNRRRIESSMEKLRRSFATEFASSNALLRDLLLDQIGVDIADFGYSLPAASDVSYARAGTCRA
jgi:hypothetical protein